MEGESAQANWWGAPLGTVSRRSGPDTNGESCTVRYITRPRRKWRRGRAINTDKVRADDRERKERPAVFQVPSNRPDDDDEDDDEGDDRRAERTEPRGT
uniref:Uncharacterized protein n=1 Tax=Peronospora matthiolae TaxID=2874970 RepID=A0AAV1V109_9STRA